VRGTWRPPSLVEKLLSGGGIKVTKGAWQRQSSGALGRDLVTGKQYSCVECFNNVD
jgi:hypothetical protein